MSGLSREEIRKQFDLPERSSKIASLLAQNEKICCTCQSSDTKRFMICCNECDKWYHGECIGVTEKQSELIEQYCCVDCRDEDQRSKLPYKGNTSKENDKICAFKQSTPTNLKNPQSKTKLTCGSLNLKKVSGGTQSRLSTSGQQVQLADEISEYFDESTSKGKITQTTSAVCDEMQCYGPRCTEAARPNSKYCSDKCGLQLATNRIFYFLPRRVEKWNATPSHADELDKKRLETIRKKQHQARARLQQLDKEHRLLEEQLEKAKLSTVSNSDDKTKSSEEGSSIYCVTCGQEIHTISAIKHLEKCFTKYENKTSYETNHRTQTDRDSLFCEIYNPVDETFCKRLKVMCPEHHKEPKVDINEVCGFPFVHDVFSVTGEFCMDSKKSCYYHHGWDKLRRAEIDMEKAKQWSKIDELLEQEREIKSKMSQRASVLSLMLHSTFNHEINGIKPGN